MRAQQKERQFIGRHEELQKGFSIRPVLIHVNGVHEEVIDQDFFSNIIAFQC